VIEIKKFLLSVEKRVRGSAYVFEREGDREVLNV